MTKSRHIAPPRRRWTEHELGILRRDYAHTLTEQIAQLLGRTAKQVYSRAKNMGLRKSAEFLSSAASERMRRGELPGEGFIRHRFQPGQVPWNKGLKGSTGKHPNTVARHFKPKNRPQTWLPVGSLRIKDGRLERKVTDTGHTPADWVGVHRIVWTEAHGPVPPGKVIVFKRGRLSVDPEHITPDALECIDRRELMARNSLHTHYTPEIARLIQLRGALNRKINRLARQQPATDDEATA